MPPPPTGRRDRGSRPGPAESDDPAAYVEAVLDLVERIPAGRVMSYGAIAEYLHDRFGRGSARRVGTIMARYGGPVPWYRVVTSDGRLPPGHEIEARRRLESEGVTFSGAHVDMPAYAWWPTTGGVPRVTERDRRDHEVEVPKRPRS